MEQNNRKIHLPSDSQPLKVYSIRPGHGESNAGKGDSGSKNTNTGGKNHK